MNDNICKFIPVIQSGDVINTINFVLETECPHCQSTKMSTVYSANMVTDGEGVFVLYGRRYKLKKGDIFFVFPALPFEIISDGSLKYIYISFIGLRAVQIMERLKITKTSPYYENYNDLLPFWTDSLLKARTVNIDILSESVLLYTLSTIGNDIIDENKKNENSNIVLKMKKYIDDNFFDSQISLNMISKKYSYNKKYLGNAFKKQMNVGFIQYLNTIRIQHACALMEGGLTSVKDISYMCGFTDQMYFSKVFKRFRGITPVEHIKFISDHKQ